jgi:glucose-1-phosphate cytidylyltransferase
MKVIILAGGFGSRLASSSDSPPKPMVHIGDRPILWHVMSIYAAHGFTDFLVACGYKGAMIKNYFDRFFIGNTNFVVNLKDGTKEILSSEAPDWRVGCVDTGLNTMTGGRVRRLAHLVDDDTFMLTYGDGVGNIDVRALVAFHRSHGKLATVTAVHPPARFGGLSLRGEAVRTFSEKPQSEAGWINGGFFVFEPGVLDYLDGDSSVLERGPLERLAADGQLMAFKHHDFWQPMDTPREKRMLESLWESGEAPWKTWS